MAVPRSCCCARQRPACVSAAGGGAAAAAAPAAAARACPSRRRFRRARTPAAAGRRPAAAASPPPTARLLRLEVEGEQLAAVPLRPPPGPSPCRRHRRAPIPRPASPRRRAAACWPPGPSPPTCPAGRGGRCGPGCRSTFPRSHAGTCAASLEMTSPLSRRMLPAVGEAGDGMGHAVFQGMRVGPERLDRAGEADHVADRQRDFFARGRGRISWLPPAAPGPDR